MTTKKKAGPIDEFAKAITDHPVIYFLTGPAAILVLVILDWVLR